MWHHRSKVTLNAAIGTEVWHFVCKWTITHVKLIICAKVCSLCFWASLNCFLLRFSLQQKYVGHFDIFTWHVTPWRGHLIGRNMDPKQPLMLTFKPYWVQIFMLWKDTYVPEGGSRADGIKTDEVITKIVSSYFKNLCILVVIFKSEVTIVHFGWVQTCHFKSFKYFLSVYVCPLDINFKS